MIEELGVRVHAVDMQDNNIMKSEIIDIVDSLSNSMFLTITPVDVLLRMYQFKDTLKKFLSFKSLPGITYYSATNRVSATAYYWAYTHKVYHVFSRETNDLVLFAFVYPFINCAYNFLNLHTGKSMSPMISIHR